MKEESMRVRRTLTHVFLVLLVLIGCYLAFLLKPDAPFVQQLTIGSGYVSLILIVLTLLIGPLRMLRQRQNPLNIYLRRDMGIWAGITGLIHVLFGFQVHMGGRILLYFLKPEGEGYQPLLNLFGLSNYLGAIATVILALLLALSNNLSLRWLNGNKWKHLQRYNYVSFGLVMVHTLGYQILVKRGSAMVLMAIGLTILVLAIQGMGFHLYRSRQNRQGSYRHRQHA